jgi:hypothetical protein
LLMKTPKFSGYALILIAALCAPALQAQSSGKKAHNSAKSAAVSTEAFRKLSQALAYSAKAQILSAEPVECVIGEDCPVTVEVIDLYDKAHNLVFCAARTPNIDVIVGRGPKKDTKIIWNLELPKPSNPPTNATYYFNGIIIFKDDESSASKVNVTTTTMDMAYKYKVKNNKLVYYPWVFQRIGNNEPVMCASIDPKIGNN